MKMTSWNAEWLDTHWGVLTGKYAPAEKLFPHDAPQRSEARARIEAVTGFLAALDPDILFLCESPAGEDEMQSFSDKVMPDHSLVTRPAGASYETGGRQWQWFLVRKSLADRTSPRLVSVDTWRTFAAAQSQSIEPDGTWRVAALRNRDFDDQKDVPVSERITHRFYREPQVLRFDFGGASHEIIGAHLKSKFTGQSLPKRKTGETFDAYLARSKRARSSIAKAQEARIKLSSEATYIRAYLDHRFGQESDPSILVVGDLNDGPGKEVLESEYLLHDLISNLQGEVFFAQRYLNHALFDQPAHLRWTVRFDDPIDPQRDAHILLDHILFTQALTRGGTSPLVVRSRAGRVEHLAFEEAEAKYGRGMLSDHRPVSLTLTSRVA
ncbi:MAG: endonuclease/exonuclease/phosphatase family protein [Pseudomonadota bacterium]